MPEELNQPPTTEAEAKRAKRGFAIRHIVVPMDFSASSLHALDRAVLLAINFGSKINLVHVAQPPAGMRSFPDGGIAVPVNRGKLVWEAKRKLDELASRLVPDELRGVAIVREGNPVSEIVLSAAAFNAGLIVLGFPRRGVLQRILGGNTGEQILRRATCPVLAVRGQADDATIGNELAHAEPCSWRRILVPLDLSLASFRALRLAAPLAQACGAEILLLNLARPGERTSAGRNTPPVQVDSGIARSVDERLARMARRFIPPSVSVNLVKRSGSQVPAIVKAAEETGVDLIVLSTCQPRGADAFLKGSVAEQVSRRTNCSFLGVRRSAGVSQTKGSTNEEHGHLGKPNSFGGGTRVK